MITAFFWLGKFQIIKIIQTGSISLAEVQKLLQSPKFPFLNRRFLFVSLPVTYLSHLVYSNIKDIRGETHGGFSPKITYFK